MFQLLKTCTPRAPKTFRILLSWHGRCYLLRMKKLNFYQLKFLIYPQSFFGRLLFFGSIYSLYNGSLIKILFRHEDLAVIGLIWLFYFIAFILCRASLMFLGVIKLDSKKNLNIIEMLIGASFVVGLLINLTLTKALLP